MKKRDVIIIVAVLAVALVGMAAVRFWPASAPVADDPAATATAAPRVRVYVGNAGTAYKELSLDEDQVLEIDQGSGVVNHVEVKDGVVRMQDSTCADKLCVGQGDMSADNVSDRVLGNLIICLPNQVMLELVTDGEVEQ